MNQSEKRILILATLLLAMMVSGCGGGKKPVQQTTQTPPPQPKPVTATLSASPTLIQRGQSSTLTWTTENADNVTLQGAKVDAGGSQSVSPTRSTDYHLIATGPGGTQDATARVTVVEQTTTTTTTQTDEEIFNAAVQDIYFDYDRADLRPDAQQSLAKAAQVIGQHPNWRVRIEGNCDERGSTEYNLSLGEERASSARQALSQGGVGGDRLQTISYGKEKPVCTESTEDCWQKNRHDHFVLLK